MKRPILYGVRHPRIGLAIMLPEGPVVAMKVNERNHLIVRTEFKTYRVQMRDASEI
jgi:hypothetical protein